MNYEERDTYGIYRPALADPSGNPGPAVRRGPGPELMGANTLIGNDVFNLQGQQIGDIKEIMLDMRNGQVGYAVMSFGGFMTLGEKLFAVPWGSLKLDAEHKRFTLDVDLERLEIAPGFDKDNWPDMVDATWAKDIHAYYGITPYSDGKI
ncbi:MAG: PRC-barrel domain-containing protein [Burkholderiaceae bacterium]